MATMKQYLDAVEALEELAKWMEMWGKPMSESLVDGAKGKTLLAAAAACRELAGFREQITKPPPFESPPRELSAATDAALAECKA